MKVIGLTGGIGAGKSTVSEYLKQRGCIILDADQMARDLTAKGSPVLQELCLAFGTGILLPDGSLDRKKLASVIFADREQRQMLEKLTTKRVVQELEDRIRQLRAENLKNPVVIDAPLLFETGADRLTDCVWLVSADLEIRINRVMERDGAEREQVLARILNQMDETEKAARATEIIDNSEGKEHLYRQIDRLLEKYAETE